MNARHMQPAALVLFLVLLSGPENLKAQATETPSTTVFSANPFGLLLEFFNAEVERVIRPTLSVGLGGSTVLLEDEDYRNLDAFVRFYPQADALNGWAFGAKAGLTALPLDADSSNLSFGLGFDVNWSQLLGSEDQFYVGIGFGLKRLISTDDTHTGAVIIPTLRIVNVGWAFR